MDSSVAVVIVAVVTAFPSTIAAIAALRVHKAVGDVKGVVTDVKAEVHTANGIALGLLADRTEGRRVLADIPAEDRTASEQGYVERLHDPPPTQDDHPDTAPR